ncbi:MAG TPA: type II secretion system F family protein [Acidimicrobiales bacterium]|nr:type II secretion system F family protein [Acidimicrobiales bacterium]
MTTVVLAGLAAGVGLVGVFVGLRRRHETLAEVLGGIEQEALLRHSSGIGVAATSTLRPDGAAMSVPGRRSVLRVDRLIGARLELAMRGRHLGALATRVATMSRLTGTSLETLCSQAALGALVGLLLPVFCWGIVSYGGLHTSLVVPVWGGILLAVAGALLPVLALSTEARRRRREARRVIGTFLDLVVLCLAGGMGIEGALHAAAQVGTDEISGRLVRALVLARDSGQAPWEALARLGADLGVDELPELAAAVGLAGTQGARIRSTLTAKAASIRRHELADVEAQANAVTERLFLPGALLLIGFLLFIGYPAVARIASGF